MLGDNLVIAVGLLMVALIPLCFKIVRRAEKRGPGGRVSASTDFSLRSVLTLTLATLALIGGVFAAYFGGSWWLSPAGSVAAAAVVGGMFCAVATLAQPCEPGRAAARAAAREDRSYRRAA